MRKNVWFLIWTLLTAVVFPAAASAGKGVYTSDAWVLGVSGDTESLCTSDSLGRLMVTPVKLEYSLPMPSNKKHFSKTQITEAETALNSEQAGRKVLDALLGYNGKGFDESPLLQRAKRNRELTGLPAISNEELRKTFPALLTHNYIYLEKNIPMKAKTLAGKDTIYGYVTGIMLFKVEVPYNAAARFISNPTISEYNSLPVNVKCVYEGVYGHHTNIYNLFTKKIPEFAPEVTIVNHKPIAISGGTNRDFGSGDLFSIYRSELDKDGNMFSKRIGYARIKNAEEESATLIPVTYGAQKAESGDIAINKGNKRTAIEANATWTKNMWGAALGFNYFCNQNRYGNSWHVLFEVGYSGAGANNELKPWQTVNNRNVHNWYIQAGAGLSRTFAGIVEVMPYAMIGYSYVNSPLIGTYSQNVNANYLRIPLGVNFGFNVFYPLQLSFTAGYIGKIGFEFKGAQSPLENYKKVNQVMQELGVAIDGLFLKAGLRYNF